MTQILEEIYLLENHYQMSYGSPALYKPYLDSSGIAVIKQHGFTLKQFESSFNYYSKKPEILLEIQENIIKSLAIRKSNLK